MYQRFLTSCLICSLAAGVSGAASASATSSAGSSALSPSLNAAVGDREFKVLVGPGTAAGDELARFQSVWQETVKVLSSAGFTVSPEKDHPWKVKRSQKVFFDTQDFRFWNKGFVIRLDTELNKNWSAKDKPELTIKRLAADGKAAPAPLVKKNGKTSETEANFAVGPGGTVSVYLESSLDWDDIAAKPLNTYQVTDFSALLPELGSLGVPAQTALSAHEVYVSRVQPGEVLIPGLREPRDITIEAWSHTPGGEPFVTDISFDYDAGDVLNANAHTAAQQALLKLNEHFSSAHPLPEAKKFLGSKVRVLLKKPVK